MAGLSALTLPVVRRSDSGLHATTSNSSLSSTATPPRHHWQPNGATTTGLLRVATMQRAPVRLFTPSGTRHASWTRPYVVTAACSVETVFASQSLMLCLPLPRPFHRWSLPPACQANTSPGRTSSSSASAGRKHSLHFEDTPLEQDDSSRKPAPVNVALAVAAAVASGASDGGHQKDAPRDVCGDVKLLCKVRKGTGNAESLDCVDALVDEGLFTLGWGEFDRQRYKAQGVLGSGGYGTVYLALDDVTGDLVAVKRIPKTRKSSAPSKVKGNLMKEAALLEEMQFCGSVVHLRDKFEDERNAYLVLEHLEGGSLEDYVQKNRRHITENDLAVITTVVLQFLAETHEVGICFADVKPSNFMLTNAAVGHLAMKVIDFGCSQVVPQAGYLSQRCGTYKYFAPEVFHQHYGTKADLWSTGIMLYRMMTNNYPWWKSGTPITPAAAMEDICDSQPIPFPPEMWERWSPEAVEFIKYLLQRDPSKRPTAVEAMTHPWITSHVASYMKQEVATAAANNIVPLAAFSKKLASRDDQMNAGNGISTSMNCAAL